jgi:hypothetical protein
MAHIRQSRPDSGLGLQGKVLKPLKVFPLRSAADPHTLKQVGRTSGRRLDSTERYYRDSNTCALDINIQNWSEYRLGYPWGQPVPLRYCLQQGPWVNPCTAVTPKR